MIWDIVDFVILRPSVYYAAEIGMITNNRTLIKRNTFVFLRCRRINVDSHLFFGFLLSRPRRMFWHLHLFLFLNNRNSQRSTFVCGFRFSALFEFLTIGALLKSFVLPFVDSSGVSPFCTFSTIHRQNRFLPRIRSGSSIPIKAFRAASFRLLDEAEPILLPLFNEVINCEDLVSASFIIRYSAARRCFLVISSNFNGRFFSSCRTSFEEV